jgi:serine/threonine protein kinase
MKQDNKSSQYIVEILKMDELKGKGAHYYYLDMELCTMDLQKFIQGRTFRGETNIWKIMSQIAGAVQFVHDRGIVIRDLKPSRSTLPLPQWRLIHSSVLKEAS